MERTKVKNNFNNFFVVSILFHLFFLTLLNIERVHKNIFIKENTMKNFHSEEIFNVWQKEIEPQHPEVKLNRQINTQINPDMNKGEAEKGNEQENIIEKMTGDERGLPEEHIINKLFEVEKNIGGTGFTGEIKDKADGPALFRRPGLIMGRENSKIWGNAAEENAVEEFNRKKTSKSFRGGGLDPNKPVNMGVFEKSHKITITAVKAWIDSKGSVIKAEIFKSSGYIELDQLALNSVRKRDFMPDKIAQVRVIVIEIDFTNIR